MTDRNRPNEPDDHQADIKKVMDIHVATWMSFSGVEAVGIGDDCIHVYFSDADAVAASEIPDSVDGVTVKKIVSGEFKAQ